jgi:hypothetical protein
MAGIAAGSGPGSRVCFEMLLRRPFDALWLRSGAHGLNGRSALVLAKTNQLTSAERI